MKISIHWRSDFVQSLLVNQIFLAGNSCLLLFYLLYYYLEFLYVILHLEKEYLNRYS
jgi:hypothetical protein